MRLVLLATLASLVVASRNALLSQTDGNGIIKLDSASYEQLISSTSSEPRDYSISVLLTALPSQFNCQPCHQFDPSFKAVAKSWSKLPASERQQHVFAQLDFEDGQAVYAKLGLQSAPTLQFFAAKAGPNASKSKQDYITYDFNRNGFSVEPLHTWTSNQTPRPFSLYKPFNIVPFIVIPSFAICAIVILYFSYPYLVPALQSKMIWQGVSLFGILVFTSGHMWNRIRNAPYSAPNGQFIAPGFSQQFVLETQLVAGLYGLLAFATIALATIAPTMKGSNRQRLAVYIWVGVTIFLFSLLVKVFKVKNPGYPFQLLLG